MADNAGNVLKNAYNNIDCRVGIAHPTTIGQEFLSGDIYENCTGNFLEIA